MKCDYCGYEWISVSPVETRELECPRCGKMSSVEADPPEPVPPTLPSEIPPASIPPASMPIGAYRHEVIYWQRREAASQRMLARVMHENRVNSECLAEAMGALEYIADALPGTTDMAISALDKINQHLAELEPEEETE